MGVGILGLLTLANYKAALRGNGGEYAAEKLSDLPSG